MITKRAVIFCALSWMQKTPGLFKVHPWKYWVLRPCKIKYIYDSHLGSILEYHSKGLKLLRLGIFGLPFTHTLKVLQKPSPEHHTPHIAHHTAHIACELILVWNDISNNNGGSLSQINEITLKKFTKYLIMEISALTSSKE